jgi:hypothetical protein
VRAVSLKVCRRASHFETWNDKAQSTDARSVDCLYVENETETPGMKDPEKDLEDWTTGNEPMTGPQRSYLQTLCCEAGEEFDESLTKAQASKKIDELQAKTGRGNKH